MATGAHHEMGVRQLNIGDGTLVDYPIVTNMMLTGDSNHLENNGIAMNL